MDNVSFSLGEELHKRIKEKSKSEDVSKSEVIRSLLKKGLEGSDNEDLRKRVELQDELINQLKARIRVLESNDPNRVKISELNWKEMNPLGKRLIRAGLFLSGLNLDIEED